VKESQAMAERLRFMIGLDSQSLLCMNAAETLLQFRQKVLVHLAASFTDLSDHSR
jgi:hypothetical protein